MMDDDDVTRHSDAVDSSEIPSIPENHSVVGVVDGETGLKLEVRDFVSGECAATDAVESESVPDNVVITEVVENAEESKEAIVDERRDFVSGECVTGEGTERESVPDNAILPEVVENVEEWKETIVDERRDLVSDECVAREVTVPENIVIPEEPKELGEGNQVRDFVSGECVTREVIESENVVITGEVIATRVEAVSEVGGVVLGECVTGEAIELHTVQNEEVDGTQVEPVSEVGDIVLGECVKGEAIESESVENNVVMAEEVPVVSEEVGGTRVEGVREVGNVVLGEGVQSDVVVTEETVAKDEEMAEVESEGNNKTGDEDVEKMNGKVEEVAAKDEDMAREESESIKAGNEGENVENVNDKVEEEVKGEDMEVDNEETVVVSEEGVKEDDKVEELTDDKAKNAEKANVKEGEQVKVEDLEPVTEEMDGIREVGIREDDKIDGGEELGGEKGENDDEKGKGAEVEGDVEGIKDKEEEKDEEGRKEEDVEEMEQSPIVMKTDKLVVEEGTPIVDDEMEMETETKGETVQSKSGEKRKRGAKAKPATPVKGSSSKVVEEDVCFICLDGGNLVLCDRRGCPKAYHPSCVDHDEEFFQTKGRWNCGWHQCNQCGKNAYFMCYTCQFSLCKSCTKDAAIFSVRGNKGFCESCMKTIMLIENNEQNEMGNDAFSDKSSWEYLFKDYWLQQKEKLSITFDELSQANNLSKVSDKHQASVEVREGNNDGESDSDSSLGNKELSNSKRKKTKSKSKSVGNDTDSSSEKDANSAKRKPKRRLKSQAKDVNSDSEHSSPDTCSKRGKKARKLSKSRSKGVNYGAADDFAEGNINWASKELLDFVMHMKNGDQSVLSQFDVQGLLLEYIKRNKLRDPRKRSQIICDSMLQKLFGKPRVAHFEMLKLLESHFFLKENSRADDNQGTVADTDDNTDSLHDGGKSRGKKSRKRGEERGSQSNLDDYAAIDMHNINLIFLRRNLMEALLENPETFHDKAVGSFVRIRISGSGQKQDIYRLVQITGTSKAAAPYKVGKRTTDVMLEILNLDKNETVSIDIISNQEFSEDECKRLRQSIKCGLINRLTVGDVLEKAKELHETRVVDWLEAEIVRLSHLRDRASEKGRKKELRVSVEKLQLLKTPEERQRRLDEFPEVHADPKMDPSCESEDELDTSQARDARPRETGFSRRGRDHFSSREGGSAANDWSATARPPNQKSEPSRNPSGMNFPGRREGLVFSSPTREHTWSNGIDKGSPRTNSREKPRMVSGSSILAAGHTGLRSDMSTITMPESPSIPPLARQIESKLSETEKMWHYRDPAGKVQGPFSMTQLRKWSSTGYFPAELRVWRISQTENDAILLTGLLAGRFDNEVPSVRNVSTSIDTPKLSGNASGSGTGGRYESSSLPSPTPLRSSFQSNQLRGGIERLPSPTPTSPAPIGAGRTNFPSPVQPANGLQIAPRSTVQAASQPYSNPNPMLNQSNSAQGLSNVIIPPGTGQNPSVYSHGWSPGYAARPETMNASMAPNNLNAMPAQVPYGQWSQPLSYGASANVAQNAWRPTTTNLPWAGQQQQTVNPNMVWAGPPTGPAGPSPSSGWVAPPGTTGGRGGDQNRNTGGPGQWNRQSSYGSGSTREHR